MNKAYFAERPPVGAAGDGREVMRPLFSGAEGESWIEGSDMRIVPAGWVVYAGRANHPAFIPFYSLPVPYNRPFRAFAPD
jgi:hypothetical protein